MHAINTEEEVHAAMIAQQEYVIGHPDLFHGLAHTLIVRSWERLGDPVKVFHALDKGNWVALSHVPKY